MKYLYQNQYGDTIELEIEQSFKQLQSVDICAQNIIMIFKRKNPLPSNSIKTWIVSMVEYGMHVVVK